ncbi:MAG TPA: lipid IV(A) 3-deoxy-D-manno-octulosonic acid transferase [Gammaproteobacteria bacterium]|jgi:3-deoxy-D-manno-octulosonic-acid transferase|nr:3-deoxy-D-manno-octulosonic acid transferase [Chromatiales bacterium]MCP4925280.1 3-deoxy-D-manno-octulosonic acid transferase [Gammaproteobacteria bacterium]MDP7297500.1 lipid IV(A) 3-deoxy-D-manno-octulosonic acid transferase [Gammaproteobacteria bacterium]MDP7660509.1 lipid IV(A) 3-deoxy-D-manno-octulosonic acid transferase [Gammaproteobacteria bacterium]HJP40016.1 lipid IV(A) 3-deoxy-D-manno-octulosonic acid transferase [Gammaproteobacteria bacterium]
MLRLAYAMLTYLFVPVLIGHLYWRSINNPPYRQRIGERFGRAGQQTDKSSIWIHAVSVGEVQAAATLIHALLKRYPGRQLIVTTMTPTGAERVSDLFGDAVIHSYVPYDLAGAVRRFFDWAKPELVIIIEKEIWPNLFRECGLRNIPLVLASARISTRSARRYRHLVGLFRETLSHGIVIAAQSEVDASRFMSLGVNPKRIHVTGNIKFDFALDPLVPGLGAAFRNDNAAGRPIWVAASTHGDEEQIVLAAHKKILVSFPNALLLLVPRHPERFVSVAALISKAGLSGVTRSSGRQCTADNSVYLGDSMGELMTFYAAADVAFVGGSLLRHIGGHNLLEPAALGLPLLTGPYYSNAPDIADLMIMDGALQVINNADEMVTHVIALFGNPDECQRRGGAGQAVVDNNRGTLMRVLELIEPLMVRASR